MVCWVVLLGGFGGLLWWFGLLGGFAGLLCCVYIDFGCTRLLDHPCEAALPRGHSRIVPSGRLEVRQPQRSSRVLQPFGVTLARDRRVEGGSGLCWLLSRVGCSGGRRLGDRCKGQHVRGWRLGALRPVPPPAHRVHSLPDKFPARRSRRPLRWGRRVLSPNSGLPVYWSIQVG